MIKLRKVILVLLIITFSLISFGGIAIKRAVVIEGKTYEKWVITADRMRTVRIIDPATGVIIRETVIETYDDELIVTTYKELNEEGKLVVVWIKYSSLDKKNVNDDGSVTYYYKDTIKDRSGNVVATGTTTTTDRSVVYGKEGVTVNTTTTETTETDLDGNVTSTTSMVETETDGEGNVVETVVETDADGDVSETTTVVDSEGNSSSETSTESGENGTVAGTAGEVPGEPQGPDAEPALPEEDFLPPGFLPDENPEKGVKAVTDSEPYDNSSEN